MILKTWILFCVFKLFQGKIIDVKEKNDFKKSLKLHSNILFIFFENAHKVDKSFLNILDEVSENSSKFAKLLTVDCQESKKLCKHLKVDPQPTVIHHYNKGKFNKVYDRKIRVESITRFLEDPTGDIPWEEDDSAKDIVHIKSSTDFQKLTSSFKSSIPNLVLMFYAPWCGYCKAMKPEFAAAATVLKKQAVFIGINGDLAGTVELKEAFNLTGYPSIFLIQDGKNVYKFDNENSKDALIKFVHNPTHSSKPKETSWPEETNEIDFLSETNFNEYLGEHESVLVMFYAPWCGHCKAMKPAVLDAVRLLKTEQIPGFIAAIDATENKNISETFKVSGYPTLKYFKQGKFQFDIHERTADGLVNFLKDPKQPQEPVKETPWIEEQSAVIHPSPNEFRHLLKRYKHSLVMYYAPWCGYCKKTKPGYTAAANRMKDNSKVAFVAVDCSDQSFTSICSAENVQGFPTLRYYNYGKTTAFSNYNLDPDEDDFVAFMTSPESPKRDPRRHWRTIPGNEAVVVLESETFVQSIVSKPGGALIMFYAPWCGHCTAMKPAFVNAALQLQTRLPSSFLGAVDATTEQKLAVQYKVSGYPTLIYFSSTDDWTKYTDGRTEQEIVNFMIKKDTQRKDKEEAEKLRQLEEDRLKKEREEAEKRQKLEEARIQKEKEEARIQKEKEEAEKRRKLEEEARIQKEKEARIQKEKEEAEKRRKLEEEARIQKEKEEARIQKEKEEAEKRRKLEEEAKLLREKEALKEKQKEDERREKDEKSQRIKEEDDLKLQKKSERQKKEVSGDMNVILQKISDEQSFEAAIESKRTALIYFHKSDRKNHIRQRLLKTLSKIEVAPVGLDVDCDRVAPICDRLQMTEVPTVHIYRNGQFVHSFGSSWDDGDLQSMLQHSVRVEL